MNFFDTLDKDTQMRVADDWLTRLRKGQLRGTGMGSHACYLQMIGDEEGLTIDEVLDLEGTPV